MCCTCDGVSARSHAQLAAWAAGEEIPQAPDMDTVKEMIIRHGALAAKYKGEYIGLREMRKHVAWYTAGFPHSSKLRARVNEIDTLDSLEQLMKEWC